MIESLQDTPGEFAPGHPLEGLHELGEAELVGNYPDGSPQWHELRSRGIGGSDIASIFHIGFTSKYMLWMQKTGIVPPTEHDEATAELFEWGHRLEAPIAQRFTEGHPEFEVITDTGSWRHRIHRFQLANPDGLLIHRETGEILVLEIKTSMTGTGWGPKGSGEAGVPKKYLAQVRWYLATFGFRQAIIVVLIGLGDYREYPVYANDLWYAEALALATEFVQSMELGIAPEIDGGKDTYAYLRGRNLSIDPKGKVELPDEVGTMIEGARALEKLAESEMLKAKGHALAHMGTAKVATWQGKPIAGREAKGEDGIPYIKFK